MKILGKSRSVAAVLAAAIGLAVVTEGASASAQIAPTGLPTPQPPPTQAKPAVPAVPVAAQPTAPAAGAVSASAKPAATAKAQLASGEKKLKANDFAGALADFEAANAAKASPEGERFIGLAQDNLGHFAEAVAAYDRFLANVPATMKAEGEQAKKRVEAIKAMPGKVHVDVTPVGVGASIMVDAAANPHASVVASPTDLELSAGKHTLRIAAEGYTPVDKDVDVTYGSKQDVRLELTKGEPAPPAAPPVVAEAPSAAAPVPPAPPPEPRSKVPAYVTGGVAILAAGVGTIFGIKALGQSSDFDKNPTTKTADDGENNALVADMMFGIAITFGVTSAVLFLSSDASQTAKAKPAKDAPATARLTPVKPAITITPAPYVTAHGGGAGALIRF